MFWRTQTKLKGLTPAIGASPNFVLPQKVLSDSNNIKYGHDLADIYRAEVMLNLDCIQRGLGNASCGPGPRPKYEIQKNTVYRYAFRMSPFTK